MPSTQIKRYLTIIHEEDHVKFADKVNSLLNVGWKHLSSGCNSVPIAGKGKKPATIQVSYWMILTKNQRIPIPA